jgi:predicted DNA-binding transcriptional regulator AlpA
MQRSQPPIATVAQIQTPVERLIRLNEVLTYTGEARTTCYDNIAAGIHPAPLKDGRASLWKLSEVHAYVAQKIARLPRKG